MPRRTDSVPIKYGLSSPGPASPRPAKTKQAETQHAKCGRFRNALQRAEAGNTAAAEASEQYLYIETAGDALASENRIGDL